MIRFGRDSLSFSQPEQHVLRTASNHDLSRALRGQQRLRLLRSLT
jgi:hypothetical protein